MKTAVITGGAGGLGLAISSQLQKEGWRIYLLDLDISRIETSETIRAIQCDLTKAEDLKSATDQILAENPSVDLVIYNAGITQINPFDKVTEESHRKVFDINYFAATNMAHLFLGAVRAAKGTHLAISSVAGFAPLYHRTTYAASKHAMEGFFKSLRSEEKAYNVDVLIAAPSFVATNLGNPERSDDGTARPGSAEDGKDYMTPDQAAAVILDGYKSRKPMTLVGRIARLAWIINRLSPRLYQRLMEREIDGNA